MGFENPTFLWGTLAAAIPIVLHLIAKRRAQVHEFAAMDFILLSNKRIAQRMRLKQFLLMLARMLLLVALPVAFAKPFTVSDEALLPATSAPTSVVLVIDSSFSMGYEIHEQNLLDKAKTSALAILEELRNESDAAIVLAGTPARALTPKLTYDRVILREAVESIQLTHVTADIQGALRMAEQILANSSQPRREVVLLTDLQASEWAGISRPWSLEHSPHVTLVDLSDGMSEGNVAVTEVEATPESSGLGRNVRIKVNVLNDRPQPLEDLLTVRLGGKSAKGTIRIPPHQSASKEFVIRLNDVGAVGGFAEISPDRLPGDNIHPFVVDFFRRVHVLVVNGSPRTVAHMDESFFLRAALKPGQDSASRFNATYVKPDELTGAQLEYVDVVVLANVNSLDATQVSALSLWVRKGGGLFISSGENVTPKIYNGVFKPLMPLPVRSIRVVKDKPVFLTSLEINHPMLEVFAHIPEASLFTAQTHAYVLLNTAASSTIRVLASFTDGAPALVEGNIGNGRVLVWTTSIDRDWTNFPFKTSFLPLMQQSMLYLGNKMGSPERSALEVGEARNIQVSEEVSKIRVIRPDGDETSYQGADLATGTIRYGRTGVPGIYRVERQRRQLVEQEQFAVHLAAEESVLKSADTNAIQLLLESGNADPGTNLNQDDTELSKVGRQGELWPTLLMGLFLLLGLETWLAFTPN